MKPCPFCGDTNPSLDYMEGDRDGPPSARVHCADCYAVGPYVPVLEFLLPPDALGGRSLHPNHQQLCKDEAVRLWNDRPELPDTSIY